MMADPEKDSSSATDSKPDESDLPKPSATVTAASRRFQQTQAQVDEVVGIMRTNVEKVLERDTKLSELVCISLTFSFHFNSFFLF